ncbi:MAG: ferrous iron transport protein B [Verrucomicrobiae bacterium]|nr:ferrous iron transport protein B [Verrucomicrobiae bacterium]
MSAVATPPSKRAARVVALAGNPNSGKTTIFNALTGARQHVGNYPGVTVEKKEGTVKFGDDVFTVVDLPGTYSLTAFSLEEIVAGNFLIDGKPDAVVDIVDASNPERNLYLAVQLMELGAPVVLALNMSDMAREKGLSIDTKKLSALLGMPVVATVGHKGRGLEELLKAVRTICRDDPLPPKPARRVDYGREIEPHLDQLAARLAVRPACAGHARWLALKLLEGDGDTANRIRSLCPEDCGDIFRETDKLRKHLEGVFGEEIGAVLTDRRYGFIAGACAEVVSQTAEARISQSERVDRIVLNRWLGLPIFALLMFATFFLTFTLGQPLMDGIEAGFGKLGEAVAALWPAGGESRLKSLLVDGIIGGVGGVLVFLPNIMLLFLAIAFLEDSGYMARAAFVMDRLMHRIGLHGKSFIPLLIGFGCTVPAIMATRTLETRRDRLATLLVLPLMSCSARLPIYALLIPAFFPPEWQGPMLWIVYAIGIALAVAGVKLLRITLFKGESAPFVMELPPYHLPTLRGLLVHMWERSWMFLRKAGTVILGISILLWAMSVWPKPGPETMAKFERDRSAIEARKDLSGEDRRAALEKLEHEQGEAELEQSLIGRIGRGVAPALAPLGFDWKISTSLLGALAAKEIFVAQMGIVYSVGQADEESQSLREKLRENYSPLQGFCVMLFCLISMPCMATLTVVWRESGSWKWALFQAGALTALAYTLTLAVFQAGSFLGWGTR